jgi:methionine-rich copper-binding protein CopC
MSQRHLALALVALVAVTGCASALPARVHLVTSTPAADGLLGTPPTRLDLRFSNALAADASFVRVLDGQSATLATSSDVDPLDPRQLSATLPPGLQSGVFHVQWHATSATDGQAAEGGFTFTVADGAAAWPRLLLSRGQADVKEDVLVSGWGFTPSVPIALTIGDDDELLPATRSDATGAFAAPIQVPNDIPFGAQRISAHDPTGARAAADLEVRWGGWPPLRVFTNGEPGPGRGQVTLTVSGRNRSDYTLEGIRIFLQIPAGAAVVSTSPGARLERGDVVWDLPPVDRSTIEPRLATFAVEGPIQTTARVEFRHRRPRGCIGDACLPSFVDETVSQSSMLAPLAESGLRTQGSGYVAAATPLAQPVP